ncbi:hypothetical protein [Natronococcus wangiae]|uniref:hypothetical protein n=1 Tax=Natronococcus wangiae TaxID=3068275 RepID=UPI00273FBF0C|nr:hypothetical protein [Natronococcus sp. AD5]
MERRTLFRLGFGGGLAALAGCLGTLTDTAGTNGEDAPEQSSDRPDDTPIADSAADEPLDRVTIGDADAADEDDGTTVYLWNDGSDERSIATRVVHDGETVLERTDAVPADAYLVLTLLEPGTYEMTVAAGDTQSDMTLEHSGADCDRSEAVIALRETGLETTMSSAC